MTTLDYSQPPFSFPISATTSRESARDLIGPAVDLKRLRNRQILFFLDTIGQYAGAISSHLTLSGRKPT